MRGVSTWVRLALLAVLAGTGPLAQAGEAAPKFVERMADRALLERVRLGRVNTTEGHQRPERSR